jgi:hypothetical protein
MALVTGWRTAAPAPAAPRTPNPAGVELLLWRPPAGLQVQQEPGQGHAPDVRGRALGPADGVPGLLLRPQAHVKVSDRGRRRPVGRPGVLKPRHGAPTPGRRPRAPSLTQCMRTQRSVHLCKAAFPFVVTTQSLQTGRRWGHALRGPRHGAGIGVWPRQGSSMLIGSPGPSHGPAGGGAPGSAGRSWRGAPGGARPAGACVTQEGLGICGCIRDTTWVVGGIRNQDGVPIWYTTWGSRNAWAGGVSPRMARADEFGHRRRRGGAARRVTAPRTPPAARRPP